MVYKEPFRDICVGWLHWIYSSVGRIRVSEHTKDWGFMFLIGMNFTQQTGYDDYYVRSGESQEYIVTIKVSEAPTTLASDSSNKFSFYLKEKLNTLSNVLVMREIHVLPTQILFDMVTSNMQEVVGNNIIVYATMFTSHLRRMTFPTRFCSHTDVVWMWIPKLILKLQRVLRKGKNCKIWKTRMILKSSLQERSGSDKENSYDDGISGYKSGDDLKVDVWRVVIFQGSDSFCKSR